jgi:hypothetical protein
LTVDSSDLCAVSSGGRRAARSAFSSALMRSHDGRRHQHHCRHWHKTAIEEDAGQRAESRADKKDRRGKHRCGAAAKALEISHVDGIAGGVDQSDAADTEHDER